MSQVSNLLKGLSDRWTKLRSHPVQHNLFNSLARFRVVPAGRRSGKTELAKRYLVLAAIMFSAASDGWFVAAAPTRDQAKRIYWADLKKLVPANLIRRIIETDMTIVLTTGTEISVVGMDQPERVEGRPLDGIILDEYADMKPVVWTKHVRPALSTLGRPGWAWFIGVPEGRNHYYKLYTLALADTSGSWEAFTWTSASILDADEIAAAMRDLDPLSFDQEYNASFVNFEGRAYYGFDRSVHARERLVYNPNLPLVFSFDFNVKPGVAVVSQEQMYRGRLAKVDKKEPVTAVIGEVWIPENSNTPMVCRKLIHDWGRHQGLIYCYGDATGGASGTAQTKGSDWDLIKQTLGPEFGEQLRWRYKRSNPKERVRLNAVNSRIQSTDRTIRTLVDPKAAPHLVDDLEGVTLIEGGAGEIDKHADPMLTHISDAFGYYIEKKFPLGGESHVESTEV